MSAFTHISVLPGQTLEVLSPAAGERFIDATLGGGGHSQLILEAAPGIHLLGLDCDDEALRAASERLQVHGERFQSRRMNFRDLAQLDDDPEWGVVDGILMDIGVSSHHLDVPGRGFSYRNDGPLDMRMDRRNPVTASTIINKSSEEDLERIFRVYGEEPNSRRLARAIVERRAERLFSRTQELTELADRVIGFRRRNIPAPTLVFQALRIAVNGELEALEAALPAAWKLLRPGGRLAVISFHSLEDRIVKNFFRDLACACICPPGMPVCICGKRSQANVITRKALVASPAEAKANSRAACAKLRAASKI